MIIMGEWAPDPKYREAFDLWCKYELDCEHFDQRVCTGRADDGTAFPNGPGQREAMLRNARKVHEATLRACVEREIPEATVHKARLDVQSKSYKWIESYYVKRGVPDGQ